MSLNKEQIENILIFDIETVKKHETFALFAEKESHLSDLYLKRFRKYIDNDQLTPEKHYNEKTALFAEFSKIICFSLCWLKYTDGSWVKNKYVYYSDIEVDLLNTFQNVLARFEKIHAGKIILAGFNHSNFDIPFMSKRYLYNEMKIPRQLDFFGKKPWEMEILDIAEFLRFKQFQDSYMSLELVCELFKLDNPKDILGGANLDPLYFNKDVSEEEKGEKIKEYCLADSIAVADIIIKIFG